jgi:hypothetical protein
MSGSRRRMPLFEDLMLRKEEEERRRRRRSLVYILE